MNDLKDDLDYDCNSDLDNNLKCDLYNDLNNDIYNDLNCNLHNNLSSYRVKDSLTSNETGHLHSAITNLDHLDSMTQMYFIVEMLLNDQA
jgi:hypothetical protein